MGERVERSGGPQRANCLSVHHSFSPGPTGFSRVMRGAQWPAESNVQQVGALGHPPIEGLNTRFCCFLVLLRVGSQKGHRAA